MSKLSSTQQLSGNPVPGHAQIAVTAPATINVQLVEIGNLREYELWAVITSVLSNFSVGFIVATIQNDSSEKAGLFILFSSLLIVATILSIIKLFLSRRNINKRSRTDTYKFGQQVSQT